MILCCAAILDCYIAQLKKYKKKEKRKINKNKKMTGFVTRFRGADHTQPPVDHQVMELVDLG